MQQRIDAMKVAPGAYKAMAGLAQRVWGRPTEIIEFSIAGWTYRCCGFFAPGSLLFSIAGRSVYWPWLIQRSFSDRIDLTRRRAVGGLAVRVSGPAAVSPDPFVGGACTRSAKEGAILLFRLYLPPSENVCIY